MLKVSLIYIIIFTWHLNYQRLLNVDVLSGDDSDAFADDEAPSSDGGYEERDDISLVSTVSSVRDGVVVSLEPC